VRTNGVPGWNSISSPFERRFFRELLLRDDLAKPGHVLEEQLKAVALRVGGGVRDVARLRAARPRRGRSHRAGASDGGWLADLFLLFGLGQQPGCCPAAGARSPGTVATARSAASSIRSRRSISSPMYRTSDASLAVLRGRMSPLIVLREQTYRYE
jgi:hypothetical protein